MSSRETELSIVEHDASDLGRVKAVVLQQPHRMEQQKQQQ
eukprot:COSAG02_NODE_63060_length_264_cov_0.630303_1_plen_39_part_10